MSDPSPKHRGPSGQDRSLRTRPLYDKLLEAFRERPGNVSYASRQAGVHRGMAKNAWEKGWKGISWARPIKARVADEGDEAAVAAARVREEREARKAAAAAAADGDRERARAERVRVLAEEMQLQASMRRGVQQVAATVLALSPAAAHLVKVVMRAVLDETVGPDGKPAWTPKAAPLVDAGQAMSILRHWGVLMGKVTAAGVEVVALGRETRPPEDRDEVGGEAGDPAAAREEIAHLVGIWDGIQERERDLAAARGESPGGAPPGTPTH